MKYLVDTCVLSELQKRRPDRSVVAWFRRRFADSMFMVSAVTIAEIKRGIREAKPSFVYDNLSDAAYERAIALKDSLNALLDEGDKRIRVLTETGETELPDKEEL